MTAELSGRVAIVAGASRGIGKGAALELGARGATVYVTGRSVEDGGALLPGSVGDTAEAVTREGGRGVAVPCDHGDDEQVAELFRRVEKEAGRLDVLVNNAIAIPDDMLSGKPFWETPLSSFDDIFRVGTRSAYVATWHAAPLLLASGGGLVANVSSSGAVEYAWSVGYGVGKAALDRITADTAHELAPHGVTVVSLWPGLVLTERGKLAKKVLKDLDWEGAESQRFTGRAIAHLAADPERIRFTGRAIPSRELALAYGFTEDDGSLPRGPVRERPAGGS